MDQVKPLYEQLHCYARARLNEHYGDAVQPATGPIRADLLGNMWAQEWGNIYDVVAPQGRAMPAYDLTNLLVTHSQGARQMVQAAEAFFQLAWPGAASRRASGSARCSPNRRSTRRRRSWRKLHIGVDAETGQILASELTTSDVDDGSQVEPLLDQITGPLASFTGDGAYDQAGIYGTIAKRHPDADVIVPPRSTAVLSEMAESTPTQRDRHLQSIAEHGRMGWQKRSGYTRRASGGDRHQPA